MAENRLSNLRERPPVDIRDWRDRGAVHDQFSPVRDHEWSVVNMDGREEVSRLEPTSLILTGRYMLPDGSEFPCSTLGISPTWVALKSSRSGQPGERVVAYVQDLGRLAGVIMLRAKEWFAVEICATLLKQGRLTSRIQLLADREAQGDRNRRKGDRIDMSDSWIALRTADGLEYSTALIDLSHTGAAIRLDVTLPVGAEVTIGDRTANVARLFTGGLAVNFRGPAMDSLAQEFARGSNLTFGARV